MRIYALRRTLEELARQARSGDVSSEFSDRAAIAELAEQLEAKLANGQRLNKILSEDTISSAPSGCPCCGR